MSNYGDGAEEDIVEEEEDGGKVETIEATEEEQTDSSHAYSSSAYSAYSSSVGEKLMMYETRLRNRVSVRTRRTHGWQEGPREIPDEFEPQEEDSFDKEYEEAYYQKDENTDTMDEETNEGNIEQDTSIVKMENEDKESQDQGPCKDSRRIENKAKEKRSCKIDDCLYKTNSLVRLKTHQRVKHGITLHNCGLCKFSVTSPIQLMKHVEEKHKHILDKNFDRSSSNNRRKSDGENEEMEIEENNEEDEAFQCDQCNFETLELLSYWNHMEQDHEADLGEILQNHFKAAQAKDDAASKDEDEIVFECDLCSQVFGSQSKLSYHLRTRHSGPYTCEVCKHTTTSYIYFKAHMGRAHGDFKCPHCNFTAASVASLKVHVERKHDKESLMTCDLCDYKGFKYDLMKHKRRAHTEKKFSCKQCDYTTTTTYNLMVHVDSKHRGIKHQCNVCPYAGATKAALAKHRQSVHEGLKYFCDICNHASSSPHYLKIHKKSFHDGIKEHCSQCDYAGPSVFALKAHIESVHGEKIHKCDQCDYATSTPRNLVQHKESIHEGIRYQCPDCEFTALKKSHLYQHRRIKHDGVTFQCPDCDFKTGRNHHLKRHREAKHEGVRYQCPHCSYSAGQKGTLTSHIERKHRNPRRGAKLSKDLLKICKSGPKIEAEHLLTKIEEIKPFLSEGHANSHARLLGSHSLINGLPSSLVGTPSKIGIMRSVPVPAAQQVEAAAMVASDAAACRHIVFDNYHYTTGTEGSSGAAPVFYVNRQTDHAVLVHDEQEFAETLASLAANPHHYGEVQTVAADTDQVQHVN